jgi:DNA topoisomerase VI subunit B
MGVWSCSKELTDNAIDACEEAEIAPVISVTVKRGSIAIEDNGLGIPAMIIESVLDYSIRISSREAYASPTRGAAWRGRRSKNRSCSKPAPPCLAA